VPRIVLVHGIGQELMEPSSWLTPVIPALHNGVSRAGGPSLRPEDVTCGFYGDLFRQPGARAATIPPYDATDVEPGAEAELLLVWWAEAARLDRNVISPDAETRGAIGYSLSRPLTVSAVQRALDALSHSHFFAGVSDRLLIFSLKQVRRYFEDDELRARITSRVAEAIGPDTRIVIGHSLGSVVAYEVLCAHPEWDISALITLGSPLGMRHVVFDRLRPRPQNGKGVWPACVSTWTNVADHGDVVALVRELSLRFGPGVRDFRVSNGSRMHDITAYLTAQETGHAIAEVLAG
jgi:hypothetical protein